MAIPTILTASHSWTCVSGNSPSLWNVDPERKLTQKLWQDSNVRRKLLILRDSLHLSPNHVSSNIYIYPYKAVSTLIFFDALNSDFSQSGNHPRAPGVGMSFCKCSLTANGLNFLRHGLNPLSYARRAIAAPIVCKWMFFSPLDYPLPSTNKEITFAMMFIYDIHIPFFLSILSSVS